MKPGDVWGLLSVMGESPEESTIEVTSRDAVLLEMPADPVRQLFPRFDPPTRALIDYLSECLERGRERMFALLTMPVDRRTALCLADEAEQSSDSVVMSTQDEIGEFVRASRGAVNRAVGTLIAVGLIRHTARGHGIFVPDSAGLHRYAEWGTRLTQPSAVERECTM